MSKVLKIFTVTGARPQFIKAAAVSAAVARHGDGVKELLVHTGQHFDFNMRQVFFQQMGIPEPAFWLDIHSQPHGAMTGRMLEGLEKLMVQQAPDVVLVYGDTNSTLAGALAARKLNIPVAHVEAGLRSFDLSMPEEVNRIVTDRISTLLFCPTQQAAQNLLAEGFRHYPCSITITGDVMLDALLRFTPKARKPQSDIPEKFVLATLHRQSNTDLPDNLISIMEAISEIANEVPVLMPLHPRTQHALKRNGIATENRNFVITEPVGYLESLWLLQHAATVLTDSGGLQKEAYFLGKTCVTLRNETEWQELVQTGYNIPSGAVKNNILTAFDTLYDKTFEPDLSMYGNGKASETIVNQLMSMSE